MITLTELFCLYDEWEMWKNIAVVYEGEYIEIASNEALADYGDHIVEHFNRSTVWLRGGNND